MKSGCIGSAINEDVVFVVDSTIKSNETSVLDFVQLLTTSYFTYTFRVGFVRYDTDAIVEFYTSTYGGDMNSASLAMSQIQFTGGIESNLAGALDVVRTQVLCQPMVRLSTWKVAVVITDKLPPLLDHGASSDLRSAIVNAKSAGIRIVAVGLGDNETAELDVGTLEFLGQNGWSRMFALDYTQNLYDIVYKVASFIAFCAAPPDHGWFNYTCSAIIYYPYTVSYAAFDNHTT